MPLMPKRTKYRKVQKGRNRGKATRGTEITYGQYGIQALENGFITSNQIEAARIAMTRYTKRGGKVWIKIFPDKPITSKPAQTRMGKGKGAPEYFVAPVKRGRILFEIAGVTEEAARRALELASHKLPIRTKFVVKELTKEEKEELELALEKAEEEAKAAILAEEAEEEAEAETETEAEDNANAETGGENNED